MIKKESRYLANRIYKYLSTNRFFSFVCKENEKSLMIDLVNNGGTISFLLKDLSSNIENRFDNPSTGVIETPLEVGHKYMLHITSSKAIGSYNIRIKR